MSYDGILIVFVAAAGLLALGALAYFKPLAGIPLLVIATALIVWVTYKIYKGLQT